jgi:hypothetical protein
MMAFVPVKVQSELAASSIRAKAQWPAPGSEDTELRCSMEQEAGHGETSVYARVQS